VLSLEHGLRRSPLMACGLLPGGRHARLHPEELRDLPEHEGSSTLGGKP